MEIRRLFDILDYARANHPKKEDVLAGKENGQWTRFSLEEYISWADDVSYGLLQLGVKKGDTVASICNNRPEWNFLDMGIMQIGAIHVPIYPTISDGDYKYILNHAEVKAIFVAGEEQYGKVEHLLPDSCCIEHVYSVKAMEGLPSLQHLRELGRANPAPEKVKEMKDATGWDDLATMIYTSGTTGNPKGVMLSHGNIITNVMSIRDIPKLGPEARAISFLPLSHVYERMMNYAYQHIGISIYYVENMATISDNAKEIHPHMILAVPRFIEKVYEKIVATGRKQKGIKKSIFFWALNLGHRYELNPPNGLWYRLQMLVASKLVFSKWRAALGGELKLIVSGGAALQSRLARVFWAAGIPVYEGYGLTETSPVISVNHTDPGGVKFGTVGPPVAGVTVKIAEDEEILCKGANVMLGYYKDEEQTAAVIDQDGWFHTGDLGFIDADGFITISGRKKEIFKTSMGKYIHPERVENIIKESSFIDNAMVLGENQKYAAALITPDFEYLRTWCKIKNIAYTTNQEMVENPVIKKRYLQEVDQSNKQLGNTEQVKRIALLSEEWTIAGGEMTPSLKLKRRHVNKKYKAIIDSLFE